jgi:lipopolysaccharide/colanic/teichoic acid biosynthesis glycosyltransferase
MYTTLSSLKIIQFGMFAFHTLVFWATIWTFDLMYQERLFLLPQHFLLYSSQVLCIYAFRGYDVRIRRDIHHTVLSIFTGVLFAALVTVPLLLVFYPRNNMTKVTMILLSAATFLSAALFRIAASHILLKRGPQKQVYVVGERAVWEPLVQEIVQTLHGKINIAGYIVHPLPERVTSPSAKPPASILVGDLRAFADPGMQQRTKEVCSQGNGVEYVPQLAEECLGRIPLRLALTMKEYYETAFAMTHPDPSQRILDLLVAVPGLLAAGFLSLFIVPAIVLESGFPVIFRQPRIGLNGRTFTIYKFRTMRLHRLKEDATADSEASHITRTGKILRKLRLDEIPQLWNVLKGDMSIVGPRPEMLIFHQRCSQTIPFYEYRLKLKPGITGWAQVNYKHTSSEEDYAQKTEFDLFYIKNRSLLLDLQIILLTAETMLGMRGSR